MLKKEHMLLPKTNIEQKLSSIKKKRILAEDIDLKQVYSILSNREQCNYW